MRAVGWFESSCGEAREALMMFVTVKMRGEREAEETTGGTGTERPTEGARVSATETGAAERSWFYD